jgi:hypothetical protein
MPGPLPICRYPIVVPSAEGTEPVVYGGVEVLNAMLLSTAREARTCAKAALSKKDFKRLYQKTKVHVFVTNLSFASTDNVIKLIFHTPSTRMMRESR